MEHERFDTLTRMLAHGLTRRGAVAVLAALTGTSLVASDDADARKKKKKKKKKVTICRGGQTVTVKKKKKQKHLQPGDTAGPCPPPAPPVGPPPGPPPPPPRCSGSTPNFCERLDSCQPACPADKVFDPEGCSCVCPQPNTCCYCTCQTEPFLCFPDGIANADACRASCADSCQESPETVTFSFAGGDGSSATCDFTNDRCNVSCEAEPMTCPAGFSPDTCLSGFVCCPPEADGGCCPIDAPGCCTTGCCGSASDVCCPAGGCCPAQAPLCCGPVCCSEDSACCQVDEDCDAGQVCAHDEALMDGCCVDPPERSLGQGRATMAAAVPAVPKRDGNDTDKERSRG